MILVGSHPVVRQIYRSQPAHSRPGAPVTIYDLFFTVLSKHLGCGSCRVSESRAADLATLEPSGVPHVVSQVPAVSRRSGRFVPLPRLRLCCSRCLCGVGLREAVCHAIGMQQDHVEVGEHGEAELRGRCLVVVGAS